MAIGTIGTGLDIPTLVAQLVAKEREPQENQINSAGTAASAKLSALATLTSGMTNLQTTLASLIKNADKPSYKTSTVTDSNFSASIDTSEGAASATAGTHQVEVKSLAQGQKLSSGAFAKDAVVGDGKLTIAYGDKTLDVTINADSKLSDIAAAINKAAGGKVVSASVITADDGQHLMLSAVDTGLAGAVRISASGGNGGLAALTYDGTAGSPMTQAVEPKDAVVIVDGFTRTSSSNTISDIVPGVNLTLTKAGTEAGKTQTLTITRDNTSLKTDMAAFVAAYNSMNTALKSTSAYNATSKTAAALTGDAMVRGLQQQLRSQFSSNINGLKDMGISLAADGSLTLDSGKMETAIGKDPDAVAKLFGKDGAIGKPMDTLIKSNLDKETGTLTQRTNSLNKQIKDLESRLDALDARMEKVSDRYTKQFTAMETLVTQMQTTSDSLTQALAKKTSS
ncbi:flagellar filament capping protein FliD [Stenotrophomonas sp. 22385]|jgi:flagellar hook-associated protein 2|uniref:flagellar filament capping protein FliD n=1 Tax=Stenotrophomonas sp. 22385 TaxID=3453915 RepID=UPI003F840403